LLLAAVALAALKPDRAAFDAYLRSRNDPSALGQVPSAPTATASTKAIRVMIYSRCRQVRGAVEALHSQVIGSRARMERWSWVEGGFHIEGGGIRGGRIPLT
jgi:hypothetical protein